MLADLRARAAQVYIYIYIYIYKHSGASARVAPRRHRRYANQSTDVLNGATRALAPT